MTRSELLTQLARRLNKNESFDTATKNRLIGLLDETYREILSWPGLQRLRDDTLTFASVADQARYALPWVPKINRIYETTNDRTLQPLSLADYRAVDPDPVSNPGVADCWVWGGYDVVATQPSDASSVFVKSTAAGDTTQTLYLEGEITDGYPRSASVALTGTTAVNVSSAISTWVRITKAYLSATCAGTVTLHEDSGSGTELARIAIGQTSQRYCVVFLYPTPSDVITYSADVQIGVTGLAQDGDVPRLPDDFHDLLVIGASMREYEKTDDGRYATASAHFKERKGDLLYWLHGVGDSPLNVRGAGWSRLGPWFPAGS